MTGALESRLDGDRMGVAVWIRMARCYGLILRRVRAILADSDLTLPQFDALAQLLRYAEGMTAGDLSRELLVTAGNVTGIITRLESRGLISQKSKPGDRRVKVLNLTASGRDMAQRQSGSGPGRDLRPSRPLREGRATGTFEFIERHTERRRDR